MNELDIVDRLSIHRTMSQYLTGGQLLLALNCDRAAAKAEIERLRTQVERHEAEIAEWVEALKRCRDMVGHPDNVAIIDAAIAKYEVKK